MGSHTFDERSHFFRDGVETTQLAIRKGDRVYVDTMLDNTRVFARNVRINTGVTAANASGQGVAPGIFMGDSSCLEKVGEALPADPTS